MHVTEFSDIPPKPEAVFDSHGHVKPSYLDKYVKGQLEIPQRMKINEHIHGADCAACCDELRKRQGRLPAGSLSFK